MISPLFAAMASSGLLYLVFKKKKNGTA